jgi:hypothetical protein
MRLRSDVYAPVKLNSRFHAMRLLAATFCGFAWHSAVGQLPGAPLLQNAWASPGIVAAANYGGSSDGSVFAGAVAWSPASAQFQISGGAGVRSLTNAGSNFAYGLRVAVPVFGLDRPIGVAVFAGIGGGSSQNGAFPDSSASTGQVPVGASIGWRRAVGSGRGFSVYATPAFVYQFGGSETAGLFRLGIGLDFGITQVFGVTGGVDFGSTRPRGFGGPSGTQFGLGLSYLFRHQ